MDKFMINEWNSVVTPNDEVYYLGDFGYGSADYLYNTYLSKLNGRIYFINGNHDKTIIKIQNKFKRFEWIKDRFDLVIDKQLYVLDHYPIESWNKKYHGSIHFHGHSHGKASIMKNRIDVGVDFIGYRPNNIEELIIIDNTHL